MKNRYMQLQNPITKDWVKIDIKTGNIVARQKEKYKGINLINKYKSMKHELTKTSGEKATLLKENLKYWHNCPVQGCNGFSSTSKRFSVKAHIKQNAMSEIFKKQFFPQLETPHIGYVKKHHERIETDDCLDIQVK